MTLTYNSLIADVLGYLNRDDAATTAAIPLFISNAEQRICREAPTIGTESYVVGEFIAGNPVYAKPGRWRATLAINFGSGATYDFRNQLYLRDYDTVRNYWPDDTVQGFPKFYADYGYSNLLIAPTPNDNYPFELCYLELPEQLSAANQTNWLTNYAPDVLLYATLLETGSYLKDDERIPMWESYYGRAIASLKNQNHSRLLDRVSNVEADRGP